MGDQSEKLQVQTATILIVEGQGDQAKTKLEYIYNVSVDQ